MRELSLNILDIAENSVRAGASRIEINVIAADNLLTIAVKDNGCGMTREFLAKVQDPFTTTRTTRKVGLGIPLIKMDAELSGGQFSITSEQGKGTEVVATFMIGHIDRPPLGSLADTMVTLLSETQDINYVLHFEAAGGKYIFDTEELKGQLMDIPIDTPEVLVFVRDMINENIASKVGGEIL